MTRDVTLVVCAAPLAERADDMVNAMQKLGWGARLVLTPAAREWVDSEQLERSTGLASVSDYRQPDQPKRRQAPDAVVICPTTFNTANKLVGGTMDNYALGVLCEAVAAGTPVVSVPMVNNRLWRHPAWSGSLSVLAGAGVRFVDPHTGKVGEPVPVQSGTGADVAARFDPSWLIAAIRR